MNLKFLKFEKKFKKKEHQPDPDLYWRIVFSVAVFLMLAGLVFGTFLFLKINNEDFSVSLTTSGEGQKINKDRIAKVLQYFTDRQDKSKDILVMPAPRRDPSI
jgi:hypothetical protein